MLKYVPYISFNASVSNMSFLPFRLHFVQFELSGKYPNLWKCLSLQQDLFWMKEIMVSSYTFVTEI